MGVGRGKERVWYLAISSYQQIAVIIIVFAIVILKLD